MAINPMQAPIDYLGQMGITPQSPTQALLEGLQLGAVFKQQRAEQEQAAKAQAFNAAASAYYRNPTLQGARDLQANFPEYASQFNDATKEMTAEKRMNEATYASQILSAIGSGQIETAQSMLGQLSRSAQENGEDSTVWDNMSQLAANDPERAYALGLQVTAAAYPQEMATIAKSWKDLGIGAEEEGYRALTPDEVASRGLPPGNYQIALGGANKGKVSQVGGGGVNVTVGGERETAFAQETGKGLAKQFSELSILGQQATRSSIRINQLEQAFRSADVKTGAEGVISTALSRFGIDIPGATEYQQIDALVASLIPLQRPEGSGTTSDKDMENFKRALPSLMGTKEGQLQIIQDMKALSNHDMKVGEIANQVRSGQLTPFEGQKRISELANPLEKYATAEGAAAGAEGVFVTGPDGVVYRFATQEQAAEFKNQLGIQ